MPSSAGYIWLSAAAQYTGSMSKTTQAPVLQLESITKSYATDSKAVVLHDVSLVIDKATFVAVMGPSGSGKSTLLQCAAGLDKPTSGKVMLGDTDLTTLDEKALTDLRRSRIGFIFQAFNLLPMLSVYENVILPLRLAGNKPSKAVVAEVLERVGLAAKASSLPSQLSGGQQQRVAIARTLIMQPEVLFADEPTGALDTIVGKQILQMLREATDRYQQTVVMVTHDPNAASWADKVVFLVDGRIHKTITKPTAAQITQEINTWNNAVH